MDTSCSKCNKIFKNKYNLNKHIIDEICTKTKQNIINKTCHECNKIFASRQKYTQHAERGCKNKNIIINYNNDEQTELLKKELEEMKLELAKLKNNNQPIVPHSLNNSATSTNSATNSTNSNNPTNSHNNTTNTTENKTINITINPYNKPNHFIDDNKIKKILNHGFLSVQELIKELHFNKEHPENHNVYISNKKNWMVTYYNGSEWVLDPDNEIIDELYDNNSMFLIEKFDSLNEQEQLDQPTLTKFKRFVEHHETPKTSSDVKKAIKFILYNKRNNVAKP
jgi:uncharacterized C2H2 Zn-finger protein